MMQAIAGLGIWLVPIVAILVWGIIELFRMILHHQEHLAIIERRIHPDNLKKNGPT